MWKNPWLILDSQAEFYRHWLEHQSPLTRPYPEKDWVVVDSVRGHQYFKRVCGELTKLLALPEADRRFKTRFGSLLISLVQEIESAKDYSLLPILYAALSELVKVDREYAIVANIVCTTLRILVGDERRLLVGTRGGKPAWKTLKRPISKRVPPTNPLFYYGAEE